MSDERYELDILPPDTKYRKVKTGRAGRYNWPKLIQRAKEGYLIEIPDHLTYWSQKQWIAIFRFRINNGQRNGEYSVIRVTVPDGTDKEYIKAVKKNA